jgi:hypothetical protein
MSQIFTLKSGTGRSGRTVWPVEAKAKVIALTSGESKIKATEAVAQVANEFGLALKPSYVKMAGSHVFRFRTEINKILADETNKRYTETLAIAQGLGIAIEAEAPSA